MGVFNLKKTKWLFELDLLDEYKLLSDKKLSMDSYYNGVCRIRGKLFSLRERIQKSNSCNDANILELDTIIDMANRLSTMASHSRVDLNQLNEILDSIYKWGDSAVEGGLFSTTRRCWIKTIME